MTLDEPLVPHDGGDEFRGDSKRSTDAAQLWGKARRKVAHVVTVKRQLLGLQSLAKDTALMRSKSAAEQQRIVLIIIVVIVLTGAATAMTKSALFHMKAAGRWDDGHEYLFGYALSLTLVVFLLKVGLVFLSSHRAKEQEAEDAHHRDAKFQSEGNDEDESAAADLSACQRFVKLIMPWVLLVAFTVFEMLSATVASLGLLYGAPTSVFVMFKASKTVFLAILSVIFLRRRLNRAQWAALLFITLALLMATCAEGKDKKGTSELNLLGPGLLLLSEFFHGLMLILQEISVLHYWTDPLQLLSASAVIGVLMTATTMYKMQGVWVSLPDGGRRPASDAVDTLYMCGVNPALGAIFLMHLVVHVSQDVAHIVILKHISALARTLCDAVKLIFMWFLGKAFWFFGIFTVMAEPWHPGLIGSWLMLPAILIIIYSMLMFKNGVFHVFKKTSHGVEADVNMEKAKVKVDLEEPFFISMFTSKKMQKKLRRRQTQDRLMMPSKSAA